MAGPTGASILVVDNDEAIRQMVGTILELEGYPVAVAASGVEALKEIDREPPRLILLDMRMPEMNGWQFARALKDRHLHIPVVVMTAARDARQRAQEIGADDYLAKPFDIGELVSKVGRLYPGPPHAT